MQHCQIYQRMLSQKYLSTLSRLGVIGHGLIMGVGWSSIFYAGCKCRMMLFRRVLLMIIITIDCRICLERLGVVQESDHTALVTRVFWRCVHTSTEYPVTL